MTVAAMRKFFCLFGKGKRLRRRNRRAPSLARALFVLAPLAPALWSVPASATSGPGCLVVVNVPRWDVLNMRAGPGHRTPVVDVLPPGRHGIIHLDGPCVPKWRRWGSRWCPVTHYDGDKVRSGWVKARYVRDIDCP